MESIEQKDEGSSRLFKDLIRENLKRTHIAVPLVILFLYSVILLCWSITHPSFSIGSTLTWFFIGFFSFIWTEYMIHALYVYTGPVQPYFTTPIKLVTEQKLAGAGEATTGGNYEGSLMASKLARQKGFDQIIWLKGPEFKKIQEAGLMNLFFVIGDTVLTPKPSVAVLKDAARNYLLNILEEKKINVEVRDICIDEILDAYKKGNLKEAFGLGTAAAVSHISEITHNGTKMVLPEKRTIDKILYDEISVLRSGRIKDTTHRLIRVKV